MNVFVKHSKELMIYPITTALDWESQKSESGFVPADYHKKDLFTAALIRNWLKVMERYFKGMAGLVLLYLDESKLQSELKFEISTNDEKFPHLYGAIHREAIINNNIVTHINGKL